MHTAIKMPLRSLNPLVVKDLQEKYPEAEISVVVNPEPRRPLMDEQWFWGLIALLDWTQEGNDDAVIEPVVRALADLPEEAILSFYDLLSEKLYLLDRREYAEHSVSGTASISSDLFLYARCGVVANGRTFYEEVLKNPAAFPKDLFFEAVPDIPEHAWLRKTGKRLEYFPKYNFETGYNPDGWGADTISL